MSTLDKKKNTTTKLDLDFYESVVVSQMLSNAHYLSMIHEYINASLFQDKNLGILAELIVSFFKRTGSMPSPVELKSQLVSEADKNALENSKAKLLSVANQRINFDELIKNTERFLKERMALLVVMDIAEKISRNTLDIGEELNKFEKIYNTSLNENLGIWYLNDIEQHIKELTTTHNPIPTKWKFLDEKTEGGLYPKTLVVFVGQINVGKSIVLGNLATNLVLSNKNVLLVTLEMSEFMYARRISSQITQIPHSELKKFPHEIRNRVNELRKQLNSNLIIKEYAPRTITTRHIEGFINKLQHKGFKLDVLVVDYINLFQPLTRGLNSYESIKEIAEHLRAIGFKYNIPVISATQLNRGSFNTASPGMEGIAESIALGATADVICSLWQEEEDRQFGIINMGMMKNRFGPNFGHGAFKCNYHTLTLTEVDPDYFASQSPSNDQAAEVNNVANLLAQNN